jgi:hypothetical protein
MICTLRAFLPLLLVALCVVRGSDSAELRRAPYLQVQRSDGISIRWRTDNSVRYTSVVRYGASYDKLDRSVPAREANKHFSGLREWIATIDGLEPSTKYYYSIEADQATLCGADERHWFRTGPKIGEKKPLRFWLLGDSGSNRPRTGETEAVLKMAGPMPPIPVRNGFRKFNHGKPLDGIILLGDNAYPFGTDVQYQAAFFNVYTDELCRAPLWPCTGNHDLDDAYQYVFSVNSNGKAGGVPSKNVYYYSVDIGNLHLVVLDPWKQWLEATTSEDHQAWLRQVDWLKRDLGATKQDWVFVVNHFPVYCDGNYNSDTNGPLKQLRNKLVPILDQYGVDMFLAGHDHTYQRSYLISGHYGESDSFRPDEHRRSESDGRKEPIRKKHGARSGTMYIVSGTGGGTRPHGKFAHPAMVPFDTKEGQRRGFAIPGSLVLEVEGLEVRGWQVDVDGKVLDQFTFTKERQAN